MAGLVTQIHHHLVARILEEVIVHQLPEQGVGQVPGYVHAGGAVGGPEIVVAQVVARDESDAFGAELTGDLGQAVEERVLDFEGQVADPALQQLLETDLAGHRIIGGWLGRASSCPDQCQRHDRLHVYHERIAP